MCTHTVITHLHVMHFLSLTPFSSPYMASTASFTVSFEEGDTSGSEGEIVDFDVELEGSINGPVHIKVLALTVSEFEEGNFGSVTPNNDPAESKWPCVTSVLSPTITLLSITLPSSLPRSLRLSTQLLTSKFPHQTTHSLEVSMVWWTHHSIHSISI